MPYRFTDGSAWSDRQNGLHHMDPEYVPRPHEQEEFAALGRADDAFLRADAVVTRERNMAAFRAKLEASRG